MGNPGANWIFRIAEMGSFRFNGRSYLNIENGGSFGRYLMSTCGRCRDMYIYSHVPTYTYVPPYKHNTRI